MVFYVPHIDVAVTPRRLGEGKLRSRIVNQQIYAFTYNGDEWWPLAVILTKSMCFLCLWNASLAHKGTGHSIGGPKNLDWVSE